MQISQRVSVNRAAKIIGEPVSRTMRRIKEGTLDYETIPGDRPTYLVSIADVEKIRDEVTEEMRQALRDREGVAS